MPVYPYGMAPTCSRRSDETDQEKQAYEEARAAFESAPFVDKEEQIKKEDTEVETEEGDQALRAREGYPAPGSEMLTFKELYIEALMHSGKCTKAMRDKIIADEEFAEDFAKVCLLVNVGRINTTLAFYPEMKTILRSYHPLPSLQRTENTRRHLQDAPRMKSLLKSVLLDGEKPGIAGSGTATGALATKNTRAPAVEGPGEETPADLTELIKRKTKGKKKAVTSVITVIFLLAMHSTDITTLHFDHPHDFFTLFFPHPDFAVPSKERARTFLWLVWHYLEGGAVLPPGSYGKNPFDDETTSQSFIKAKKAWENLGIAEQAKVNVNGYWRGTKNPEYQEYKKRRAAMEGNKDREGSTESRGEDAADAPPELLDRVLAPALSIIDHVTSARENVDDEEEKAWGQQMREERGAFLIRFQEEEQAKIQEADEQKKEVEAEGEKSMIKDGSKGGKKRSMAGGGSSYPLANILAAANAEKAAAVAAATAAAANGEASTKRQRGLDSAVPGEEEGGGGGIGGQKADSLWDLDLSVPRGAMATIRGSFRSDRTSHSLPRQAWRRILERAQRGVGDASYESDDEAVALDEARDERPRVELARVLRTLREVRTSRGEIINTNG